MQGNGGCPHYPGVTFESRNPLPRWAAYAGLWLLLSSVFASQLFLAGYVTPWPRAFAAEAVYWLSWWLLAPVVFWWCRRLRSTALALRVVGLLLGALVAAFFQPLIGSAIQNVQNALGLCVGDCVAPAALLSPWEPCGFACATRFSLRPMDRIAVRCVVAPTLGDQ